MAHDLFKKKDNLARGACLVIASSAMFALMGAAIKTISPSVPFEMVVFFRNFFGLLILSPWMLHAGAGGIKTQRLHLHGLRTCSGLAAMYCFFYALGHLQLGEAVLLNFSAPLFVPLIAFFWLREAVPQALRWALVIGVLGIACILKPTPGIVDPVAFIGLASGIFAALATVTVRDLSKTEPPERTVFYFGAMGTLVSAVPLMWNWQTPDIQQLGTLLAIGALATAGQVFLTRGITNAPAGHVGPFAYSSVVFAAVIGWAVWGELLDVFSLLGGLMVGAAGVIVLRGDRTSRTTPET
jgi:drug/metabolite transporter (DMT)-like permease